MTKVSERERIQALETKLKHLKVLQQRRDAGCRNGVEGLARESGRRVGHASDSPTPGADRSPNSPGRRRILLAKVEDGLIEDKTLKTRLDPALEKAEDRALFGLAAK